MAAAVAAAMLLVAPSADAHMALDALPPLQQQRRQQLQRESLLESRAAFDPAGASRVGSPATTSSISSRQREASSAASEAMNALQQLAAANELLKQGDSAAALQQYTELVQQHPSLAFTQYARLGRAITLYQEGATGQALAALNELEVTMRGNPEVHAALACVLYAERPEQRFSRAEQQWAIALDFDARYGDAAWVARERHWPPRLLGALERFLALAQ